MAKRTDQSWFIRMMVLMLFILIVLVVGQEASGHREEVARHLGVTVKDPWQLTKADLNQARLVYNLVTKPGYYHLIIETILVVMLLSSMIKGVELAYHWQRAQMKRALSFAKDVAKRGVVVEISGTVRIGAERGVIYVASVEGADERYFLAIDFSVMQVAKG